ncbi:MAG: GNAT family N-acetyltransferase [Caldilineales bacterium]|nr:GNAT family N-acetyltransferase [Caldilineales bacterium]
MSAAPAVRPFAPHEWSIYRELRLRALADAPDAFGSTLAAEQERADEDWAGRLAAADESGRDLPLVAEMDGEPVGLGWGRIEADHLGVAHLYQMWVAPGSRNLGVGRMLLEAVIAWAKEKNARYLDLGVTYRESSAMRLYRRAGFEPAGDPEPLRPGSKWLFLPMRLDLRSDTS